MPTWSYGVTTISSRVSSGLLERTLASLAKGGFPEPHLFIDGLPSSLLGEHVTKLRMTCHNPAIRIYGNFHLALSELFIREPKADFYAMFQDDLVTYPHLRDYLESCQYPKGYWNLYTFPENEKPEKGWYLSNQLGKGAVALVFNNDAARILLKSERWLDRPISNPKDKNRLWKFIDGGIVEALRQRGYSEYVHNPSLVQHTGEFSTVGNSRHVRSRTFKDESFDALDLIRSKPEMTTINREGRIGLVGYSVASGIGELNRQIAEYADVYRWLVKPHSKYPMQEPKDIDFIVCPLGAQTENFVKSVDIVLFPEVPYYNDLIDLCKKHGKRIVCIPMIEWMPADVSGWPSKVDLFICPTKQCYDMLKDSLPCTHFPWPVDTERFEFRQRTTCEKFLFINGHGGWHGRKGGDVLRKVLAAWPEMPLVIYDQSGKFSDARPAPENNADLYTEGDVLISPHSVDGLGLEGMEAMACGIPVISTDGQPWNEVPSLARIRSTVEKHNVRRMMDWHTPSYEHLFQLCKDLVGKDISQKSLEARRWAVDNSWANLARQFNGLVRGTKTELKPIIVEKPQPKYGGAARWDKFLFIEAIEELKKIGGIIIVELGAIRNIGPNAERSDGWSTAFWSRSGAEVHTVDNDLKAITTSKRLIPNGVHYHHCDGFDFLKSFEGKIDLLYLDGPDANKGGQEFHLKALLAAPLSDKCLLLMDDCDLWPSRWQGRGKGELAIPKALEMGFKIIKDNDRQVLLARG